MALDLVVVSIAKRGDGRSIIGLGDSGFVRLIAPTHNGILYPKHYSMANDAAPRVWDRIRVHAPWPDNRSLQPENRIIDRTTWQLLERPVSRDSILPVPANKDAHLFGTRAKAIPANSLTKMQRSILCIEPQNVTARCVWRARDERMLPRLAFRWQAEEYDLPLLDARWADALAAKGEGEYALEQIGCRPHHGLRLIISLGEPFEGWCYKLVTGILCLPADTLWRDARTPFIPDAHRRPPGLVVESTRSAVGGA